MEAEALEEIEAMMEDHEDPHGEQNDSHEGRALDNVVEMLDAAPQTSERLFLSLEELSANFASLDKLAEGIACICAAPRRERCST